MLAAATYFRNFIFGVEDSLVSTVGLLSGIAIAGVASETIVLTGAIPILAGPFSMAVGSFLSESSAAEYVSTARTNQRSSYIASVVMFASYFLAGFIPLAPYMFFAGESALALSVACSLLALFVLGAISGALSRRGIFTHALRMMLIGGIAIAAGVAAGILLG